ncbi:MAG: hypothetical protein U5N58_10475 [Actinomycetota bacterium]|nr:hypothetical protein [Actinomycetota bacterium]
MQGTGKTSSVVKLANYFQKEHHKKVSVVALRMLYRPAAVLQLKNMAEAIGVEVYSEKGKDPVKISVHGSGKI